ncbi:MAG: chromosomal replication initiator protein DnaA [Opitutaceae bacterium]|nr:chromosomal replication initiator protein DnaA [Opitutaceae bacterium]
MSSVSTSPSLWESAKNDIRGLFPEDVYKLWFEPISCIESSDDSLTLGVPTDFAAFWIQDNYLDLITQRLRLTAGRMITVRLRKSEGAPTLPHSAGLGDAQPAPKARNHGHRRSPRFDERNNHGSSCGTLNQRNTFETFVVGNNNQMAHAASLAVAQAPAQAYNPLFLYGDTGLGKTHLMHAIGHTILKNNPEARVAYLSTEKFTNEFIQGLQENALTRFRQRYRSVDILLIDDVQFLAEKERIQEEFFHTFNELFESGKQIVLSSDRRASEIAKLEARLVSRFEWGLPADIQAPDYETRFAILRTKAAALRFDAPAEVLSFIAQHISRNIRRLEGALIKVASYSGLTGRPITLATTEELLKDVLMEQAQHQLTVEVIQKKVTEHYQLRMGDMTSKRRPNNIAIPRQIAMYLARTLTKLSLQEIGDAFGGRDHGTVIHACKAVDIMMEQDSSVRGSVEFLKAQLSR